MKLKCIVSFHLLKSTFQNRCYSKILLCIVKNLQRMKPLKNIITFIWQKSLRQIQEFKKELLIEPGLRTLLSRQQNHKKFKIISEQFSLLGLSKIYLLNSLLFQEMYVSLTSLFIESFRVTRLSSCYLHHAAVFALGSTLWMVYLYTKIGKKIHYSIILVKKFWLITLMKICSYD